MGATEFQQNARLVVTFDTVVLNRDIHQNSVRVEVASGEIRLDVPLWCYCDVDLNDRLRGGNVESRCDARSPFGAVGDPNAEVNALEINLPTNLINLAREFGRLRLRILIHGDFIRGRHRNTNEWHAVDADHIPKTRIPIPPTSRRTAGVARTGRQPLLGRRRRRRNPRQLDRRDPQRLMPHANR